MIYVRMTDRFMSGWGNASNAVNVLVIACSTYDQAVAIERAAKERPEMRRVAICNAKPRSRPGVVYSFRHVSELGGLWLKYMPASQWPYKTPLSPSDIAA